MVKTKNKGRTFEGMKYRQVQRKNSRNRNLLSQEQQKWLKVNNYRNLGWNNVINLFTKIREIRQQSEIESLSLEELFLEAERLGNKYLDNRDLQKRNLEIAQELGQIANLFDTQFPDNTVEVIDYAQTSSKRKR